jgi:hypothetical protein
MSSSFKDYIMSTEKINIVNSEQTRIALLEQSIGTINQTLIRIENEIKDIRKDMKTDFRWLLTIIAGLGAIMAHGFHWF